MAIPFTKDGYEKLNKNLQDAEKRRPEVVKTLTRARAMGDLSENGFYKSAKAELGDLDRKIRELNYLIKEGVISEKPQDNSSVQFGHKVILEKN